MEKLPFAIALSVVLLSAACGDSSGTGGAGGAGATTSSTSSTSATTSTSSKSSSTSATTGTSGTTTSATTSTASASTASATSSTTSTSASSSSGGNPNVTEVPCQGATIAAAVTTSNFMFMPTPATIAVGDTVSFAPESIHTVTADDGSFNVSGGQTKCFTFSAVGTYPYHCSIHTTMLGSVIVQ